MSIKSIGERIALRRKELGMTQRDLAEQLNITDRAVSRWERGIGAPEVSLLEPLAKTLKMSIDELMTGSPAISAQTVTKNSNQVPEWMRRRQEALDREEREKEERLREIVPVLGTWMTALLWLMLPTVLVALLLADTESKFYIPGQILSWVLGLAVALIYFRMSSVELRYRRVGWFCIGVLAVSVAGALLLALGMDVNSPWLLIVILPKMVFSLLAVYNEFAGHTKVLEDINEPLSEKWEKLRPAYMTFAALEHIAMLLIIAAPVFGMVVSMIASIGVSITSILQLIYMFKTAKFFREYPIVIE